MSATQSTFKKFYFDIPSFVGRVFRATRIPSIIILLDLIGLPILFTVLMMTKVIPLAALPVGIYQLQSPSKRTDTTFVAQAMATMSPEQLDISKTVAEVFLFSGFIAALCVFWWVFLFLRFLSRITVRETDH